MATIEKYQTSGGATLYRVRYRTPDNRSTQKRGFKRKIDAERWANTVEVNKMTGQYIAPSLGRITVAELGPEWLTRKKQHTAPSHYRMLESAWRVHVSPRWGKLAVADVDLLSIEAWIASMGAKGAGATTVLRAHGVLSGILADAVKSKRLSANPAKGVENLPRKTSKRRVYLSAEDVYRLADESGQHRTLVLMLAYTGIRWGEAVGLRMRDVEFLRRRLNVHENAVQLGVGHAVGPTKGHKARSVPVPAFVLNGLSVRCGGQGSWRPGVPWRRRLPAAAEVVGRVIRRCGQQSRGPNDHPPRSTAHVRIAGCVGRGECSGIAADARAHVGEGHARHLCGSVRRRSGCRRGHSE